MKKNVLIFCLSFLAFSVFAQDNHLRVSPKLSTDRGWGVLKLGATYQQVASVLEPMSFQQTFENISEDRIAQFTAIYTVKAGVNEYTSFAGKKVDRVEVYFANMDNEKGEKWIGIKEIRIFINHATIGDLSAFSSAVEQSYGAPYSHVRDNPEEGDWIKSWFGAKVVLALISNSDNVKDKSKKYLRVEFTSSEG